MNRFTIGLLAASLVLPAAPVTYQFAGTVTSTMTVNDGTHAGTIAAGTPFTGTLTFDDAQAPTPAPYGGGTKTNYAFTQMTLTIGATTIAWGPGNAVLYDNLTVTSGYPSGDSLYINMNGVAPVGTINGAGFNFIFLGFVDTTGTAFTGGKLPGTLSLGSFGSAFIEFNYGAWGQPWGAGNTSTLQFLSSFSKVSSTPTPPPTITTTSLPNGVVGVPYAAALGTSAPNNDPVSVAVTGLPPALGYANGVISGTPTVAGTSNVVATVTDTVTGLSTSATLSLTVNNPAISFNPTLAAGVVNAAYSATFAPATGGTGVFTYGVTGLPVGLTLTGNTVSGTPTASGTFNVMLTATDSSGAAATVAVSLVINTPAPVTCSGTNGVLSAYVPRNPGFIVVNGGLNLLDHLWTSNLNPTNTTFLGGLVNWYKTGLIVDWTGTSDPLGCILTQLTVRPAVTISTTTLPAGTVGVAYSAPLSVTWGATPYNVTVAGLPAGLTSNGTSISGTPTVAGTFAVTVTAVDAVRATATATLSLIVAAPPLVFNPTLPAGTAGSLYSATLAATGYGPFTYAATGLPTGLTLTGATISGTPATAGSYAVTLTATDASGASLARAVTLTINPAAYSFSVKDEGQGLITAIGPDYLLVGTKKLLWNAATAIKVNTPNGPLTTITNFVKVGMKIQWKGMLDKAANVELTTKIEIN